MSINGINRKIILNIPRLRTEHTHQIMVTHPLKGMFLSYGKCQWLFKQIQLCYF